MLRLASWRAPAPIRSWSPMYLRMVLGAAKDLLQGPQARRLEGFTGAAPLASTLAVSGRLDLSLADAEFMTAGTPMSGDPRNASSSSPC